jgi:group I intron endonuclease
MNIVYGIKCEANDKYYVGSTTQYTNRKSIHIRSLKNDKHHSQKLQRAWNKYGEANFVFEKLEEDINYDDLMDREQFWMDKLDSYYNGYNGYKYSSPCPASHRNGMWKQIPKTKGNISTNRKAVVSYNITTGEIQFFDYVMQVQQLKGIGPQFIGCITIEKILKNNFSNLNGCFWFYENDFNLQELKMRWDIKNKPNPLTGKSRPQNVRDKISNSRTGIKFSEEHSKNISIGKMGKGNKIKRSDGMIFGSIREGARYMGCHPNSIGFVLNGKNKSCKGFTFEYV